MLAIFDKSVAVCPDNFKKRHRNSLYSHDNEFLVNHFVSLHPDSVVTQIGASAVIAYHLHPFEDCPRFRFGVRDDTLCIYQGSMEDVSSLENMCSVNPVDDEIDLVIKVCKIMQEARIHTPKKVASNLIGDFSFILHDTSSNLLFLTSATSGLFPIFWGIDSERSLILSDDPEIVEKARLTVFLQPFPPDYVYISRRGHAGLEAILQDYTPEEVEQKVRTELAYVETPARDVTAEIEEVWQPPPPQVFKINTQGIAFPGEKMVGIGVIVRNSSGKMIMAGSKRIKRFSSHLDWRGWAVVEGLSLALKSGFRNVIWESVNCDTQNSAYTELVVRHFNSIAFSNISTSANKAAFGLAEYAKEVDECIVWVLEIPECISSVVETESYGHA